MGTTHKICGCVWFVYHTVCPTMLVPDKHNFQRLESNSKQMCNYVLPFSISDCQKMKAVIIMGGLRAGWFFFFLFVNSTMLKNKASCVHSVYYLHFDTATYSIKLRSSKNSPNFHLLKKNKFKKTTTKKDSKKKEKKNNNNVSSSPGQAIDFIYVH